jgi:tRNA/tmRNA/rRNA uracil-C5-methylase (TrmA/RlmC/RlmD family)
MSSKPTLNLGDHYTAEIGKIAHGGHFVTHVEGCVVFVRGAMTGERAKILITHTRQKVYFGVAQEILEASQYRVDPSCVASKQCGGCDFQYVDYTHQRVLKTRVLKDSLERFAQLQASEVEKIVGEGVTELSDDSGLGWRARARFEWNNEWQMHENRSDMLVNTPLCTTVTREIAQELARLHSAGGVAPGEYTFAQGSAGVSVVGPMGHIAGPEMVTREFAGVQWETDIQDFWQANRSLLPVAQQAIIDSGAVRAGEDWWDLYGGAGVFARVLSLELGAGGSVATVEGNRTASQRARDLFAGVPESDSAPIRVINSSVESFIRDMRSAGSGVDGILLDPPRSGAGISVCADVRALGPRSILYVACDPVALARDVRELCSDGKYELVSVRAWDAFPMTHHFESLAVLRSTKVS